MKPDFRYMARSALAKAKEELSEASEDDLRYAALQLRMAMEALTYDQAMMYAEDLGREQMETWQPKQLMDRILEVAPQAGQSVTVSVGVEPSYCAEPDTMAMPLGSILSAANPSLSVKHSGSHVCHEKRGGLEQLSEVEKQALAALARKDAGGGSYFNFSTARL